MNQLQLKDIACYLPYGLNLEVYHHIDSVPTFTIDKVECASLEYLTFENMPDWYFNSDENETSIKPILRPMDLTKPITVNGEELIPIVELAKIAKCKPTELYYKNSSFYCVDNYGVWVAEPQQQLFDWLDEHMFDRRDLINKGLAVADENNIYNS